MAVGSRPRRRGETVSHREKSREGVCVCLSVSGTPRPCLALLAPSLRCFVPPRGVALPPPAPAAHLRRAEEQR